MMSCDVIVGEEEEVSIKEVALMINKAMEMTQEIEVKIYL